VNSFWFTLISSGGAIIAWSFSPDKEINYKIIRLINDRFSGKSRKVAEAVVFAIFGAIVSMVMVRPDTAPQALAGGMAWFSFVKGETIKNAS
jgi:hypothetical protein